MSQVFRLAAVAAPVSSSISPAWSIRWKSWCNDCAKVSPAPSARPWPMPSMKSPSVWVTPRRTPRGPPGPTASPGRAKGMIPSGTMARLTSGTATGMTTRRKVRPKRPRRAGVMPCR